MEQRVGVIGLGIMGSAMSTRLLAAGFPVLGYDLDTGRLEQHLAKRGTVAASPAEVAREVDILVTSLPSAEALVQVFDAPDGIRTGAHPELVVLETSTLYLDTKHTALDLAAECGITLLDCPVSGTGRQALSGDLVAYLSGDDDAAKQRVHGVLRAMTRGHHDLGSFGNGTRMKLIANLLVAVHNMAAAEALLLAQRAGLDLTRVLDVVGDGAGNSRMFELRGPMMAAGDYSDTTMSVTNFQKDLAIIGAFAADVSSPTPLLATTSVFYRAAQAQGRSAQDTACVFAVLQGLAQL
jgi:putative dehydrogenase